MIHSFRVEKDEMIPMRSIVQITVSRNVMKRKRSFARSLPLVKKASAANVEGDLEKMCEEVKDTVKGAEKAETCQGTDGGVEGNHRAALHGTGRGV